MPQMRRAEEEKNEREKSSNFSSLARVTIRRARRLQKFHDLPSEEKEMGLHFTLHVGVSREGQFAQLLRVYVFRLPFVGPFPDERDPNKVFTKESFIF